MSVPKLRFPEFRDAGAWEEKQLGEIAALITEKTGNRKYTLMSINSGVGLVSQIEKFGREIAGSSYKNYFVIRKNDFAYNKSATKDYPEGFIAMHSSMELAAVPNSIFTCFRTQENKVYPQYLKYLFLCNLHGKWLKQFISVGARAHGSLNIDNKYLLLLPIPLPKGESSLTEQQKIADCLSSIADRITAETQKLDTLKAHKKGLMQQLFPAEGETLPKLRFPEFQDSGEWEEKQLDDVATIKAGTTPSRANPEFYANGSIPWVKTTDLNNSYIYTTQEKVTPLAKVRLNPVGSILVAMYGGFNQIGRTGYLKIPAATNQAISVLNVKKDKLTSSYLLIWLNAKIDYWKKFAISSRKDANITGSDVAAFPIALPSLPEQQKIADCLTSIDEAIAAQSQAIELLKLHKKGLMQQLFPSVEEVKG